VREILASTADSHFDSNGLIDVIKILKNVLCSRAHVLRKALRVSILQCAPQHVMFLCIFLKDLMLSAHVFMFFGILLSSCVSLSQHLMLFRVLCLYKNCFLKSRMRFQILSMCTDGSIE
jgi:hypothetical protein